MLRAAAADGQAAQVEALLGQGVPADSPDASGETALMQSVRADHPAVAALLIRHGASLDRTNRAGQSARDLAAAKGDAVLNQALGLGP
jgi:ankyrin repeat protein